ncbi:MAG: Mov34/MPN/PAD-1 family protein [Flavobacteriales bacterium]|nr:Mov34/MPN/PAD-1 family protein [Flavobacteriales bacterium]
MNIKFQQPKLGLTLLLPEKILQQIQHLASQHYPKEFGGIFLGSSVDETTTLISCSVIPDKYVSDKTSFTRHPDNLNDEIHRAYNESNGQINYLGEWHTHPDGSPNYSTKDLNTMRDIGESDTVVTDHPLLLIMGIKRSKCAIKLYILHNKSLFEYGQARH